MYARYLWHPKLLLIFYNVLLNQSPLPLDDVLGVGSASARIFVKPRSANLHSHDRDNLDLDTIELVEAAPASRLHEAREDTTH